MLTLPSKEPTVPSSTIIPISQKRKPRHTEAMLLSVVSIIAGELPKQGPAADVDVIGGPERSQHCGCPIRAAGAVSWCPSVLSSQAHVRGQWRGRSLRLSEHQARALAHETCASPAAAGGTLVRKTSPYWKCRFISPTPRDAGAPAPGLSSPTRSCARLS